MDGDTITFASSLSGNTITLGGTELLIDKSLTIDGDLNNDGIGDITITANNSSRVFNINDGDNANDSNVILDGLTITGGSTIGDGGGILNYESLTITNSTVSGNSANANGGGIDNNGTLNITNSTVSGNSAGENGGGIFFQDFINLQSTIVADNIISSHVNSDIFNVVGTITASNSLIENGGFITNDEGNNIIGEDPLLDPNGLQDNGGPTLTIALQSGSPAINTGSNPNSLTTDQRGMGFSRTLGSGTDIGAFELNQTSTNIRSFKVVDVNEAPTDIQLSGVSIQENSANETVVGTLTADDPESDEVTFTLTNDAGGRFTIANDNKVQVADGASLNDD